MPVSYSGTAITWPDSSTTTSGWTGFKNRIINGNMVIDQRNAGASVTPTTTSYPWPYCLDRWNTAETQASKFSVQQNAGSVTPPVGFTKYLGVTSLSAYSVTSSDIFLVQQRIEGYNVADFGFGTASASTVTLSFWVRSSLTGTFGGSFGNVNDDRSYPFSYTISAANTWEQKTITVAGDTTGTWGTTTGIGLTVTFGLGSGSTYSATAGAWTSGLKLSATGATSVVGTNGATWYITGVQLERGSTASSFEYLDYGNILRQCQRYFTSSFATTTAPVNGQYNHYTVTAWEGADNSKIEYVYFPVAMRASPTMTPYGNSGKWQIFNGSSWLTPTTTEFGTPTNRGFTVYIYGSIGNTSIHPWYAKGDWTASAEL